MEATSKPHAVFVPFPLSTHINPSLKLAKLIHQKGFHITFITTESHRDTILSSRGPHALDGLPDFRFQTLPIDIPPSNTHPTEYFGSLLKTLRKVFLPLFTELLRKLNDDTSSPKVSCIVSDGVMTQSVLVAEELGIPVVLLWILGASGFSSIAQYRDLVRRCVAAVQDVNYQLKEDLDNTTVDFLPGKKGMSMREFLNFLRTAHTSEFITESCVGEVERTSKASALILLTCEHLERQAIGELKARFSHVYSIAPLPFLLKNQVKNEQVLTLVGDDIWKEDTECSKWLDSKPPKSVLYISFGSFAVTSQKHLVEFAWGLAKSKHNFIWIIRPDMVVGESAMALPQEFIEESKERGLILSWCQQEQVLNHPAVGGFLSHCGWNSVLESISAGVPMICWPFFGEHVTTCKMVCKEWGFGIEIDEDVERGQVEKVVKELLEGETSIKLRERAKEWMKIAKEAADPSGVSTQNLDKLVSEVLLSQKCKS
ncbi:hypothetical protein LguiB_004067 [Lonicera macranthoides]